MAYVLKKNQNYVKFAQRKIKVKTFKKPVKSRHTPTYCLCISIKKSPGSVVQKPGDSILFPEVFFVVGSSFCQFIAEIFITHALGQGRYIGEQVGSQTQPVTGDGAADSGEGGGE